MFRFLAALTVVILHTVLVVPNAAQSDCNECLILSKEVDVLEIAIPRSYFLGRPLGTYRWSITQMDPDFFVQINITKLSLARDPSNGNCFDHLTIMSTCSSVVSNIIEMGCESLLPSIFETDAGCNLTITVFKHGTWPRNPTRRGFKAILTLEWTESLESTSANTVRPDSTEVSTISTAESTRGNIIPSTEGPTESSKPNSLASAEESAEPSESSNEHSTSAQEESNHASNQSAKVTLPIALVILAIIIIITLLLVLVVRFKWIRKTNESKMNGTSLTNSAYSQNEIMARTTLGQNDQVNGIVIERNGKTDQKKDKDLDHLQGEGVVSNPVYVSGAEKNQEHAYQSVESNDLNKQHEYAYVDTEFLRDGQMKMTYKRSSGETPNTTLSTTKTIDGNLDHLEGDGVEYNPIYASN